MDKQSFFHLKIRKFTLISLLAFLERTISGNAKIVVANHNLHSLYLCLKDRGLAAWINQQEVHADGMAIIYLGKIFGAKLTRDNRITYVDLMPGLLKLAERKNGKLFYLGSSAESLSKGLRKIRSQYPTLSITGHHGYFDKRRTGAVIKKINSFAPDILLVGMGMPKQEYWIRDNFGKLRCKVVMPCGAAIDYYAKTIATPPRWSGRMGLEWFFRLMAEPKRLWRRYLLEPFYIFWHLLRWKIVRSSLT